jgi:hypothetical protein
VFPEWGLRFFHFSGTGSNDTNGTIANYTWTFTYDGLTATFNGVKHLTQTHFILLSWPGGKEVTFQLSPSTGLQSQSDRTMGARKGTDESIVRSTEAAVSSFNARVSDALGPWLLGHLGILSPSSLLDGLSPTESKAEKRTYQAPLGTTPSHLINTSVNVVIPPSRTRHSSKCFSEIHLAFLEAGRIRREEEMGACLRKVVS